MHPVPWHDAWQAALYGPAGFYRDPAGPAGHFTTSAHGPLGPVLAEAVAALADRERATHVVDVGAGRGELLVALRARRPDLRLTGVEVVDRPDGLPPDVEWLRSPGGPHLPDALDDLTDVLVVANEWLDVVPCPVLEIDDDGVPRGVLVDAASRTEDVAGPVAAEDAAWCARHWPTAGRPPGYRVEVGRTRDLAWAGLVARVRRGTVLAVDYGHTAADRPPAGTLVGYRAGTPVPALPDGRCDLTAHVTVDSLEQDERCSQRAALADLGVTATRPPLDLARTDPAAYLAALARSSAVTALTDPGGLGGFHWVLRRVPGRPAP